jgi:hypothetical protein
MNDAWCDRTMCQFIMHCIFPFFLSLIYIQY